jgi:hypothetical protein
MYGVRPAARQAQSGSIGWSRRLWRRRKQAVHEPLISGQKPDGREARPHMETGLHFPYPRHCSGVAIKAITPLVAQVGIGVLALRSTKPRMRRYAFHSQAIPHTAMAIGMPIKVSNSAPPTTIQTMYHQNERIIH